MAEGSVVVRTIIQKVGSLCEGRENNHYKTTNLWSALGSVVDPEPPGDEIFCEWSRGPESTEKGWSEE